MLLFGAFLIAHGLVHAAIYSIPPDPDKPASFDPRRSRVLAAAHVDLERSATVSVAMSWVVALLYVGAGSAFLADSSAWLSLGVSAAALGLVLKGLFFHPWLVIGVLVDVAILWTHVSSLASG